MKLTIHGAGKEVGRSCLEINNGHKIILDAGVKLGQETEYPEGLDKLADADMVFLSHAHLDHSGSLPLLKSRGLSCPVVTNSMTKALTRILLKDSYKIDRIKRKHISYNKDDIYALLDSMKNVKYGKNYFYDGLKYKAYDAGHIPGSSMFLIEMGGKKIFYTGDFNTNPSLLLDGSEMDIGEVDCLITESTYGDRVHPDRVEQIDDFIKSIKDTIDQGGSVIIPVFAVGRAQEVLLMLKDHDFGVPMYLDGMAKKVNEQILQRPRYVMGHEDLRMVMNKTTVVRGFKQREKIAGNQGIFITTSGMLEGGPVLDYLAEMCQDEKNSILLTGYQAENTNGRLLVEEGTIFLDGWKVKVKANLKHYDFSAHVGQKGLRDFIKMLNPKKVVFVHGDENAADEMSKWAKQEGYDVSVPQIGDSVDL